MKHKPQTLKPRPGPEDHASLKVRWEVVKSMLYKGIVRVCLRLSTGVLYSAGVRFGVSDLLYIITNKGTEGVF